MRVDMELETPKLWTWVHPYQVVPGRRQWLWNEYSITFEGDKLFVGMNHEQASLMCGALNGAYNLGRQKVLFEQALNKAEQYDGKKG
jgi:hypothetical protein